MKTWLINYQIKGQKGVQQTEIVGENITSALAQFRFKTPEIVRLTKYLLIKQQFTT